MENKKKSKGLVIAIIIFALAVGGFFIYEAFFDSQEPQVEAEKVEVKEVATISLDEGNDSIYLLDETKYKVFNILEENDATFYTVTLNNNDMLVIKQGNKEDFESISPESSEKLCKIIKKGMSCFLNTSYKSLPPSMYSLNGYSHYTIFGKDLLTDDSDENVKKWIKETFGEELKKMFTDYELELSCESIDIKKAAVYDTGKTQRCGTTANLEQDGFDAKYFEYFFIVEADVKTENAKKKISELGVFADEGESKKIEFLMYCNANDASKDILSLDKILL